MLYSAPKLQLGQYRPATQAAETKEENLGQEVKASAAEKKKMISILHALIEFRLPKLIGRGCT